MSNDSYNEREQVMTMPRCERCQGLLAWDYLMESSAGGETIDAVRCINCGNYWYDMAPDHERMKDQPGQTHQQIGKTIGVTKQRVHQIEQEALRKLKKTMNYQF